MIDKVGHCSLASICSAPSLSQDTDHLQRNLKIDYNLWGSSTTSASTRTCRMQSIPRSPYVLLLNSGSIFCTGKLFFQAGSTEAAQAIYSHYLHLFAKSGEKLVAVWGVQIYQEFEKDPYPYSLGGLEEPPSRLGELNQIGKGFQTVIAWDQKQLQETKRPQSLEHNPNVPSSSL